MAAEYFVDHYRLWSNGNLQHRKEPDEYFHGRQREASGRETEAIA